MQSLIIAKWHTLCVIHHQSQMWQLKILICSILDKTSDWLIVNLESVMVNATQFTYSPVLSHSHPSTQVKVARGINKHNIKPWMKICLRRLQEQQNKEIVFYCWWRLHASSTLKTMLPETSVPGQLADPSLSGSGSKYYVTKESKVMGLILQCRYSMSGTFLAPCSCHVYQFTFDISLPSLKFTTLIHFCWKGSFNWNWNATAKHPINTHHWCWMLKNNISYTAACILYFINQSTYHIVVFTVFSGHHYSFFSPISGS